MTHPTSRSSSRQAPKPPAGGAPGSGGHKRSVAITLLALGAGAVTVGMYAGAGSDTGPRTFADVNACEAAKPEPSVDCRSNFTQALYSHERSAPTFATREACEKEYGAAACVQPSAASGRSSMFIPAMAAFMIAQRAGGGFQSAPLYRRPGDPPEEYRQSAAFPFATSSSGSSSSSSNRGFWGSSSSSSSRTTTSSSSRSSSMGYTSTSRGGFGSSGRSSGS